MTYNKKELEKKNNKDMDYNNSSWLFRVRVRTNYCNPNPYYFPFSVFLC